MNLFRVKSLHSVSDLFTGKIIPKRKGTLSPGEPGGAPALIQKTHPHNPHPPTGAAIRDIVSILGRRFPSIPVVIYPAAVQGDAAVPELISALDTAIRRDECDVLIMGRGGGSLEDLWAFNEDRKPL